MCDRVSQACPGHSEIIEGVSLGLQLSGMIGDGLGLGFLHAQGCFPGVPWSPSRGGCCEGHYLYGLAVHLLSL